MSADRPISEVLSIIRQFNNEFSIGPRQNLPNAYDLNRRVFPSWLRGSRHVHEPNATKLRQLATDIELRRSLVARKAGWGRPEGSQGGMLRSPEDHMEVAIDQTKTNRFGVAVETARIAFEQAFLVGGLKLAMTHLGTLLYVCLRAATDVAFEQILQKVVLRAIKEHRKGALPCDDQTLRAAQKVTACAITESGDAEYGYRLFTAETPMVTVSAPSFRYQTPRAIRGRAHCEIWRPDGKLCDALRLAEIAYEMDNTNLQNQFSVANTRAECCISRRAASRGWDLCRTQYLQARQLLKPGAQPVWRLGGSFIHAWASLFYGVYTRCLSEAETYHPSEFEADLSVLQEGMDCSPTPLRIAHRLCPSRFELDPGLRKIAEKCSKPATSGSLRDSLVELGKRLTL